MCRVVQLVSVYVNNWCGPDGEQADSSVSDYNTLPHYQRYQRCLQHQQQACHGHYHTGQRAQLMYETVGRRNCVDAPRAATLCSRHGRSNSLSPGRARYAAGQLCTTARLRRQLMAPADYGAVPAKEATAAPVTLAADERAATLYTQPVDAEQSAASSAVDTSATDNAEVCDQASAEPNDADGQPGEVPLTDDVDGDSKHTDPMPQDTGQPSIVVVEPHDSSTDTERCAEKVCNDNDDEVMEAETETEERNVENCSGIGTVNQGETDTTKDDCSSVTNDVVDGDQLVGEISSKDPAATAAETDDGWPSKSPEIRFDQADAATTKFDSSALEKILNSLSATSRHEHTTTDDCNSHDNDDDVDDEIWMRRDVVENVCQQSSLSVLDAAVAQLDSNGLHFKSRRRRSTTSSSSSSSSVGHCSPSCLMPPSTHGNDIDTSASLLLSCVSQLDTSTDATVTLDTTTAASLVPHPSADVTGVEPADTEDTSSQTAG